MSSDEPKPKRINIKIQLDDDIAQGRYANLVMLNHTETEFVLDFLYVQPQQPKAKVHSRVITSPRHAKLLLRALQENVSCYEKRFGEIPEVSAATKKLYH
ncbi:MAG: hypothetical protein ACI9WU_001172 [Myxococcota bacterium]|jgi:hypothetical protein